MNTKAEKYLRNLVRFSTIVTSLVLLLLTSDTSRAVTLVVRRCRAEADVTLRRTSHKERRHGHELTSDGDVSLTNHDTSHVDRSGKTLLQDKSLKTSIEELLGRQVQHEIESLLVLVQKSVSLQTTKERITFENSLGVILRKSEQLTSSLTKLGKRQLRSPDFSLTSQSVLSAKTKLGVESLLLERTTGCLESFRICRYDVLCEYIVFVLRMCM